MPNLNSLLESYQRNVNVIMRQAAGMTHAGSLLQPAMRGNCMNWVLGHILSHRSILLEALHAGSLFNTVQHKRYGYGSQPVCAPGEDIITLEQLLTMLNESQARIRDAVLNASETLLAEDYELGSGRMTVDELILFLLWHETYHTGQTEYQRQLTGVDDHVI